MVKIQTNDSEQDASGESVATVTESTLPASPEELRFFEDEDGTLFTEHKETGNVTAITDGEDSVEFTPALVEAKGDKVVDLDTVSPMSVQTEDNDTQERGD